MKTLANRPECIPCNVHTEGAPKNFCGTPKNDILVELEVCTPEKGNMFLCCSHVTVRCFHEAHVKPITLLGNSICYFPIFK